MIAWLLKSIVGNRYAKTAALVLIAFSAGAIYNNHYATKAALERQSKAVAEAVTKALMQDSANRQRENHNAILTWTNEQKRRLEEEHARDRAADAAAIATLEDGKKRAELARAAAMAELAKEKETNRGLKVVNQLLADPVCVLDGNTRRVLDTAAASTTAPAAAGPAGARDAAAVPAGGADAPPAADPPLTCDQLVDYALELIRYGGEMQSWVLAFQDFENRAAAPRSSSSDFRLDSAQVRR